MSEPVKYLQESDVKIAKNGIYAFAALFGTMDFIFEFNKIRAKTAAERGYFCELKVGMKKIQDIDFPIMGEELTPKIFADKFNEVFEVDYLFRKGLFEHIFGEIDERLI